MINVYFNRPIFYTQRTYKLQALWQLKNGDGNGSESKDNGGAMLCGANNRETLQDQNVKESS